jgi:hypothetical protein
MRVIKKKGVPRGYGEDRMWEEEYTTRGETFIAASARMGSKMYIFSQRAAGDAILAVGNFGGTGSTTRKESRSAET